MSGNRISPQAAAEPSISVHAVLEGRADPIAKYLIDEVDDEGIMSGDFADVLIGVSDVQGCDRSQIRVMAVSDDLLTASDPFPRLIGVVCSEDRKAPEFYIAASFEAQKVVGGEFVGTGEVDLKNLEFYAWDRKRRAYQFYETIERRDGTLEVDPSPTRCMGCHLTPADMKPIAMHMTPIMNELIEPWTHWSAFEGFTSFDFIVPERAHGAKSLLRLFHPFLEALTDVDPDQVTPEDRERLMDELDAKLAAEGLAPIQRGPASLFEQIIRNGQSLVASARVLERNRKVTVAGFEGDLSVKEGAEIGLGLLRPLYCNEQVQYVSELRDTRNLPGAAIIDDGLRSAVKSITASGWPTEWKWLHDDTFRIPEFAAEGEALKQIPVRGNSDLTIEQGLVGRRVLSAIDVLRVRALDWKYPVFSEFRCGLWKNVAANIDLTASEIESDLLAELESDPENKPKSIKVRDLVPHLYRRIMHLGPYSLIPESDEELEARLVAAGKLVDSSARSSADEADRKRIMALNARFITLDLALDVVIGEMVTAISGDTIDQAQCGALGEGFCLVTIDRLGGLVQAHRDAVIAGNHATYRLTEEDFTDLDGPAPRLDGVDGSGTPTRVIVRHQRDRRICHVTQPVLPQQGDDRFGARHAELRQECSAECCADELDLDLDDLPDDRDKLNELGQCVSDAKQAMSTVENFDLSMDNAITCAVQCAVPSRFVARPSLPKVDGNCVAPNRYWPTVDIVVPDREQSPAE